jgi:hypothetical protein
MSNIRNEGVNEGRDDGTNGEDGENKGRFNGTNRDTDEQEQTPQMRVGAGTNT